jgi:hypothetical protein
VGRPKGLVVVVVAGPRYYTYLYSDFGAGE